VDPFSVDAVRRAYDTVADDYDTAFGDDLTRLPVDRQALDEACDAGAGSIATGARVLEVGCGPGPASAHLADRCPRLLGVDVSAAMLAIARRRTPALGGVQADMRCLPFRDGVCGLAIACYSLQHVPRTDLVAALAELGRVIVDGGWLVVATHLGEGDVHIDEFLGHRVATFAGALHGRDELLAALAAAGFAVERERQREPLPHEHPSRRIYLLAHRRPR
jgi:ubiquinone/menaquinone biosynthesis C-methylase UbiE